MLSAGPSYNLHPGVDRVSALTHATTRSDGSTIKTLHLCLSFVSYNDAAAEEDQGKKTSNLEISCRGTANEDVI